MQCLRPEAIGCGHLFDLCLVHLSELVEKRFGLRLVRTERIERHSPVRLFARLGDLLHRIIRPFPAKNIFAVGIWKVINLLWLPGPQIFKQSLQAFGRAGNLLGECSGITRQVERLCRQYSGSLMIPMVFANKCSRQKSQDDFRTSQANEAHQLFERNAVIPVCQRQQHILRRRILAAEKPHVVNP